MEGPLRVSALERSVSFPLWKVCTRGLAAGFLFVLLMSRKRKKRADEEMSVCRYVIKGANMSLKFSATLPVYVKLQYQSEIWKHTYPQVFLYFDSFLHCRTIPKISKLQNNTQGTYGIMWFKKKKASYFRFFKVANVYLGLRLMNAHYWYHMNQLQVVNEVVPWNAFQLMEMPCQKLISGIFCLVNVFETIM